MVAASYATVAVSDAVVELDEMAHAFGERFLTLPEGLLTGIVIALRCVQEKGKDVLLM